MKAIVFLDSKKSASTVISKSLAQALHYNKIITQAVFKNTRTGSELATTYSIMNYPAMVLLSEDGSSIGFWQGRLPSQAELTSAIGYI